MKNDNRIRNRKINYLNRVLQVQSEYKTYKQDGLADAWLYRKYIKPKFHISLRTFRSYLDTNAKRELKELE